MTDELNQSREVGKSIVDNWPLLAIIFAPIAEIGRRAFKSATKEELKAACHENEERFDRIHDEIRQDMRDLRTEMRRGIDDIKAHLMRRNDDAYPKDIGSRRADD